PYTVHHDSSTIAVRTPTGGVFIIVRSGDPDVRIQEQTGDSLRNRVAIELKGGTDYSNVHNRAGEAEKSHQKAKGSGYQECWTVIMTRGVDMAKLGSESPSTDVWFDASQILGREGPDWDWFRRHLYTVLGIQSL
ncbi:MAG: XcyI family restriction endonuclease, partial [Dehalococcoidia bacterium]